MGHGATQSQSESQEQHPKHENDRQRSRIRRHISGRPDQTNCPCPLCFDVASCTGARWSPWSTVSCLCQCYLEVRLGGDMEAGIRCDGLNFYSVGSSDECLSAFSLCLVLVCVVNHVLRNHVLRPSRDLAGGHIVGVHPVRTGEVLTEVGHVSSLP